MKNACTIVLLLLLMTSCSFNDKSACTIKGVVFDRDSKVLLMTKGNEDATFQGVKIPINDDNTFEYTLDNPQLLKYTLVFEDEFTQDYMLPISFVPDGKVIEFELYPQDRYVENNIKGSPLSTELLHMGIKAMELFQSQFDAVNSQLDPLLETGQEMSGEVKALQQKTDTIMRETMSWWFEQIESKQSIAMYSVLIDMILASKYQEAIDKYELRRIVNSYQLQFPQHFYSQQSKRLLKAMETIKVGGVYADFTAPDKDGKVVKVSDIIKSNKLTLIDLWAPWCGPCRKKSRATVPVYQKYKDAGFGIIGVVGGVNNKEAYTKVIAKEDYPWQNLMELNKANKIWEMYNITNSGGGRFLVNQNGEILTIGSTAEELEKKLKELL